MRFMVIMYFDAFRSGEDSCPHVAGGASVIILAPCAIHPVGQLGPDLAKTLAISSSIFPRPTALMNWAAGGMSGTLMLPEQTPYCLPAMAAFSSTRTFAPPSLAVMAAIRAGSPIPTTMMSVSCPLRGQDAASASFALSPASPSAAAPIAEPFTNSRLLTPFVVFCQSFAPPHMGFMFVPFLARIDDDWMRTKNLPFTQGKDRKRGLCVKEKKGGRVNL